MDILFIVDPIDSFNISKDSSYAMMREAQRRGHTVFACGLSAMRWSQHAGREQPDGVQARVQHLHLLPLSATGVADAVDVVDANRTASQPAAWYTVAGTAQRSLAEFDAVIMRKDPPFDSEYYYATCLLSQAEREGARVFNTGAAIRNHSEKLALMEFAQYAAATLVSRDAAVLKAFHAEHRDVIFKPLDGMGGAGVFRVKPDALNLGSVLEQLTHNGQQSIMAQRYLPEITAGDKRVLIIDGQPVPFALARIPQGTDIRGNLAAGAKGVAQPLSDYEREIARNIGSVLAPRGLFLIGLDIIGDCVTEINVTSPTCFQEIMAQTDCDVAKRFTDALENRIMEQ